MRLFSYFHSAVSHLHTEPVSHLHTWSNIHIPTEPHLQIWPDLHLHGQIQSYTFTHEKISMYLTTYNWIYILLDSHLYTRLNHSPPQHRLLDIATNLTTSQQIIVEWRPMPPLPEPRLQSSQYPTSGERSPYDFDGRNGQQRDFNNDYRPNGDRKFRI